MVISSVLHWDWIVQGLGILFGTFVLEDAATVLAAMDVQVGRVPLAIALGALYIGIVLGDAGLYGLGALAVRLPWARRWVGQSRVRTGQDWLENRVFKVVFISRFLPGARLPTYTACGFLGADLRQFLMAAIVATLIWTSILFSVSLHIGRYFVDHLGAWRWVGMIGFALTILLVGRMAARLQETPR
jgi:membrane protein DedA with SNARE-associated domain